MPLVEIFKKIVGDDYVITDSINKSPYLVDWRGRYQGAAICIVRPSSTEEVSAVVRACHEAGVAIVPQGGNTGLCGGSIPVDNSQSVVVNLSRLNRIRQIDPGNNTITVDAGCILQDVQSAAQEVNRLFPLSLAAEGSCEIGGNLSTNAGGVQVLRYGNMRELTLGIEVVLPDGRIWNGLRGLRKDNTGYDLKHLFIGAEGTLGIITAAVLKLFPRPQSTMTAWLAIDSPKSAINILSEINNYFGNCLTACELVSDIALELVLKHVNDTANPVSRSPWYLLIELSAYTSDASLYDRFEEVLGLLLESQLISDAVIAQSVEQSEKLWQLRERISEAQKAEGLSIKHDIAVPVSSIGHFLKVADQRLREAYPDIRIVAFGHVGDGNLHYNQSLADPEKNAALLKEQSKVNQIVYDVVHQFEGTISAEHGIGQLKREQLAHYKSDVECELMRRVKQAFDPNNIMNPGKLVPPL